MSCRSRLQSMLLQLLADISAARRRTLTGNDPEGLHDFRVALRALRAILPLLGKKTAIVSLRQQWQTVARTTGPCRDLEVMLEWLERLPAPQELHSRITEEERRARKQLEHDLSSAALPLLLQKSRKSLSKTKLYPTKRTIHDRGLHRAHMQIKSIRKQILALGLDPHAQDWHNLRLTIKRLRYLIEYCAQWLPRKWATLYPALTQSQAALGNLHDLDMLQARTGLGIGTWHEAKESAARASVAALFTSIERIRHSCRHDPSPWKGNNADSGLAGQALTRTK